jgi:hypothetical protein
MSDDLIGSTPCMDAGGFAFFKEALAKSRCYLEYGCGGSTTYVCKETDVHSVFSVDSSEEWVDKVKRSLSDTRKNLTISHVDIGPIGDWGRPINRDGIMGYWKYMTTPWDYAKYKGLSPDTILVDGRFRVASFLYSLLSARNGSTLLFDDYIDRPQYHVVEQFCEVHAMRGRMAVFYRSNQFSYTELTKKIAQYSIVPD